MGGGKQGVAHEIPLSDRGVFSEVGEVMLWKGDRNGQADLLSRGGQVESPQG